MWRMKWGGEKKRNGRGWVIELRIECGLRVVVTHFDVSCRITFSLLLN